MEGNISWFINNRVEKVISNLEKHNMKGIFVKDEDELKEVLKDLIQ